MIRINIEKGFTVNGEITWFSTYIDHGRSVSCFQIVQDASFVKIGQGSHIFSFFELWRVHLLNVIFLHSQALENWTD